MFVPHTRLLSICTYNTPVVRSSQQSCCMGRGFPPPRPTPTTSTNNSDQCSANVTKMERKYVQIPPKCLAQQAGLAFWSVFVWWGYAPQLTSTIFCDHCSVLQDLGELRPPPNPPAKAFGHYGAKAPSRCPVVGLRPSWPPARALRAIVWLFLR